MRRFPFLLAGVLALGAVLAQTPPNLPMPTGSVQPKVYEVRPEQMADFMRPIRTAIVFGPDLPFPLELTRGMTLEVIAGKDLPPKWVDEAKRRGARVRVYLLPGTIARGSFFVAGDRYLFTPSERGWRVVESPEVALIVKAYLAQAMRVAAEMGVVR